MIEILKVGSTVESVNQIPTKSWPLYEEADAWKCRLQPGDMIDAWDNEGRVWREATVKIVEAKHLVIHFQGDPPDKIYKMNNPANPETFCYKGIEPFQCFS